MSGLFRRKSNRRSEGPESAQAEPGAADAPPNAPAEPGGHESLLVDPAAPTRVLRDRDAAPGEHDVPQGAEPAPQGAEPVAHAAEPAPQGGEPEPQGGEPAQQGGQPAPQGEPDPATTVHPVVRLHAAPPEPAHPAVAPEPPLVPVSDLPAGVDPDELAAAPPTSARRGRQRKRVSFLRAAREVLLRDLGGFVYELHRTAGDIEHEAHRRLREVKLARLTRVDTELHELELRLDDVRRHVVVREPGVGGECPNCGELFGSDAHFCSHCGLPLTESARRAISRDGAAEPQPVVATEPFTVPDQPTEEFSPLGTGEFRWPARTGVQPAEGEPAARDETARGEAVSGEPEAAREETATGEAVSGEPEAARDEAATGEAVSGEPEAARDEAASSEAPSGEPVAARDEIAAGDAAPGDAVSGEPEAARDESRTGEAASGEPVVARDEAGEAPDEAAADDAAPRDGAATRDDAPRDAAGGLPEGAWHDSPGNGRDETYRPVERRG